MTFDETLHAAPKWRENEKSSKSHLPNMLVRRDIAGWGGGGGGSKTDFLRKVIPARNFLKFFQLFCFAVRSSTGISVMACREVGSHRSRNFSKSDF